ncbi:MAG: 3-deoxy-7-phosphoheptulonate synthase [Oscillospiraceae bacterium]|nr:3-deoxy-7-phosphoheptulonate synthase [Oscillospiraceae bacterium]
MSIIHERVLPAPDEIKKEIPLSKAAHDAKAKRDGEIKNIFKGEDDRLLLIIGPCSADREEPVIDYIHRLARLQEKVSDKILMVPRIYTNKPRTTGDGYKGMLHQPNPLHSPDMLKGIIAIRDLHMCALRDYGFSCADEMLYPDNYRYLSDVLSYVAVGARSVENQQHRLTSSGLEVPVGMKNPTGGDISVMMNAITAAQHKHTFIYRGWEVESDGNEYAHAILRGFTDGSGHNISNYHYEDILRLCEEYEKTSLKNPAVIIDCNHANSGKKYLEQIRISKDVIYSRNHNADIKKLVKGLMIESYIEDGAQKIGDNIYGKSITDPCLGWEKTERLIYELADEL